MVDDGAHCACGEDLWWLGKGRPPTKCPECGGPTYKDKPGARRVKPRTRRAKLARNRTISGKRSDEIRDYTEAMRVAVWEGLTGDRETAIRLATGNPELDSETAARLGRAAAAHDGLQDGKQSATAELINRWLALAAIEALEKLPLINPGQIAGSLRTAQQALDGMGGGKLAFPHVTVEIAGPVDNDDE